MGRRLAVIIGNSEFEDRENFSKLDLPINDASDFSYVLEKYGEFEVQALLLNETDTTIRKAIERLYSEAQYGDLTLLYYSGHGYKTFSGQLFLVAGNTFVKEIKSTGIWDEFIQTNLSDNRCRHNIIIFDCCFSGTFVKGIKKAKDEPVDFSRLQGETTAFLASSGRVQYSIEGKGPYSLFTKYLIDGITTGRADQDLDGYIGISELFYYAEKNVRIEQADQKPFIWLMTDQQKLYLAKASKQHDLNELLEKSEFEIKAANWETAKLLVKKVIEQDPSFYSATEKLKFIELKIAQKKRADQIKGIVKQTFGRLLGLFQTKRNNYNDILFKSNQKKIAVFILFLVLLPVFFMFQSAGKWFFLSLNNQPTQNVTLAVPSAMIENSPSSTLKTIIEQEVTTSPTIYIKTIGLTSSLDNKSTNTISPTPTIDPRSPVGVVISYYSAINQKDYQKSWGVLTDNFHTIAYPQTYDQYSSNWKKITNVRIISINEIDRSKDSRFATVRVELSYIAASGTAVPSIIENFGLVLADDNKWYINNTVRLSTVTPPVPTRTFTPTSIFGEISINISNVMELENFPLDFDKSTGIFVYGNSIISTGKGCWDVKETKLGTTDFAPSTSTVLALGSYISDKGVCFDSITWNDDELQVVKLLSQEVPKYPRNFSEEEIVGWSDNYFARMFVSNITSPLSKLFNIAIYSYPYGSRITTINHKAYSENNGEATITSIEGFALSADTTTIAYWGMAERYSNGSYLMSPLTVWNFDVGGTEYHNFEEPIQDVVFSKKPEELIVATFDKVYIYNYKYDYIVSEIDQEVSNDIITKIALSNLGQLLVLGRRSGNIDVVDINGKVKVITLTSGNDEISAVSFSNTDDLLATMHKNGKVIFWHIPKK